MRGTLGRTTERSVESRTEPEQTKTGPTKDGSGPVRPSQIGSGRIGFKRSDPIRSDWVQTNRIQIDPKRSNPIRSKTIGFKPIRHDRITPGNTRSDSNLPDPTQNRNRPPNGTMRIHVAGGGIKKPTRGNVCATLKLRFGPILPPIHRWWLVVEVLRHTSLLVLQSRVRSAPQQEVDYRLEENREERGKG